MLLKKFVKVNRNITMKTLAVSLLLAFSLTGCTLYVTNTNPNKDRDNYYLALEATANSEQIELIAECIYSGFEVMDDDGLAMSSIYPTMRKTSKAIIVDYASRGFVHRRVTLGRNGNISIMSLNVLTSSNEVIGITNNCIRQEKEQ